MDNPILDDFNDEDEITVDTNLWNYKEQKTIIGVVIKNEEGQYGLQVTLSINEEEEIIIPTLTALEHKLKEVVAGDKVKIVSLGNVKSKTSGREYADFKVYIKKTK